MAFQQEQWPEFAVLNLTDRPWLLTVGTTRIGPWGDRSAVAVPIGLGLAAIGLMSVRRRLAPLRAEPAAGVLLVWLGGYALAILGGLGLSYPRYFLPTCLLMLPLIGTGAAWLTFAAASLAGFNVHSPGSGATPPDGPEGPSSRHHTDTTFGANAVANLMASEELLHPLEAR